MPQTNTLKEAALHYHEHPLPGKLAVKVTKPMATQRDLSLAYSPGVAEPCLRIAEDEANSYIYTGRGNRVAVISNGTAVLGLGDIGAAGAKPVMEGKVALFKKFADIDGIDIEVNEKDATRLAEIVVSLEPTFGAVNLEDIGAPACFEVERLCKERMGIPVFHDDQHGTAIVVAAAALNALRLAGKSMDEIRIVAVGAGAAGIACLNLLCDLGVKRENIWMYDRKGLVHEGRSSVDATKAPYSRKHDDGPIAQTIKEADMFLGLSGPGNLTPAMVADMAANPIIFALANPTPEILPEEARSVRDDVIIATGRSDYPNQVNNVLCFPFMFRGALDVGARQINEAMKVACAHALADLARMTTTAETAAVYRGERMIFGRDYLIPKPFDPRLLGHVSSAVADAAMRSGVAARPLPDIGAYKAALDRSVYRTGMIMRSVFEDARSSDRRIVFAEGEDERVLHCVQSMVVEGMGHPTLIGRPEIIRQRIERAGITIRPGKDFEICDPDDDPRYRDYWQTYHLLLERQGVTPDLARTRLRTNATAIAAVMVHRGEADSMICGTYGRYASHLQEVTRVLGKPTPGGENGQHPIGALSPIILDAGTTFIADSYVHSDPAPAQIADIARSAAHHIRRFGIEPKVALVSHSFFGNLDTEQARKMRRAIEVLDEAGADFQYEGEMNADQALNAELRARVFPNSRLVGAANCLVFPNADTAAGVVQVLRQLAGGLEIGPILMGMGNSAHVVNTSITARGLLNVAALARATAPDDS